MREYEDGRMPDPNEFCNIEYDDLDVIAQYMYDPQDGMKMITQALHRGDFWEIESQKRGSEIIKLQEKLECTKITPEQAEKLEYKVQMLSEENRAFDEGWTQAKAEIQELKMCNKELRESLEKGNQYYNTAVEEVITELANALSPIITHLKEPAMREVDEVWVEEAQAICADAERRIAAIHNESRVIRVGD